MILELIIHGEPKAKQSARFTKSGFSYLPKDVVQKASDSTGQIIPQLPENFELIEKVNCIKYEFTFLVTKGLASKKANQYLLNQGGKLPKVTKPDVDNLLKFTNDIMNGLVLRDDAIIHSIEAVKNYGYKPYIKITIDY